MFVQGRFRLKIPLGRAEIREHVEGDRATVVIRGRRRTAEVELIREEGRWRVSLDVPPVRRTPAPPNPLEESQEQPEQG